MCGHLGETCHTACMFRFVLLKKGKFREVIKFKLPVDANIAIFLLLHKCVTNDH